MSPGQILSFWWFRKQLPEFLKMYQSATMNLSSHLQLASIDLQKETWEAGVGRGVVIDPAQILLTHLSGRG